MANRIDRREFLELSGIGTVVLVTGFGGRVLGAQEAGSGEDFYFLQMSDTHIGFHDPAVNPDFAGTLKKAVARVNALEHPPAFIMFTGDLSQSTDNPDDRRARLKEFKAIADQLTVKDVRFMPGEHDAASDKGAAYMELFGKTHYSFEHQGVYFIVLDNVSDPTSSIGDEQLQWFAGELNKRDKADRIVVFTHRPLFSLYPQWDWWTRDGQKAIDLLMPFSNAVVFYGHIHQEHHFMTGSIPHYAAMGLMYPLPAPGSVPVKHPVPWDPTVPYKGLGFREIGSKTGVRDLAIVEYPLAMSAAPASRVIKITAKKFEFNPATITLKKGEPVVLEFTTLDVMHGFNCPDLGVRCDIKPGETSQISVIPQKAGSFTFTCDVYCGEGHDGMNGTIKVVE
jgi:plastocyanin